MAGRQQTQLAKARSGEGTALSDVAVDSGGISAFVAVGRVGRKEPLIALADQAVSSISNFAITLVAAHTLSARDFGLFAIVMSLYVVAAGVSQGLGSTPYVIRYASADADLQRRHQSGPIGAAATVGLGASLLGLALGKLFGFDGPPLWLIAAMLPLLLVQDAFRYVFVARRLAIYALGNDVLWLAAQTAVMILFNAGRGLNVTTIVVAWGVGGIASVVLSVVQTRSGPNLREAATWVMRNHDLAWRYGAEALINRGTAPLGQFLVAAGLGLASVGELRSAQVVFSPFNFLFIAVLFALVPHFVRIASFGEGNRVIAYTLVISGAVGSAVLAWFAVVTLDPWSAIDWMLARNYNAAVTLVIPVTLQFLAIAISIGPQAALRARGASRVSLSIQALHTLLLLLASSLALLGTPVAIVAYAIAIASVCATCVWWAGLVRAGLGVPLSAAEGASA